MDDGKMGFKDISQATEKQLHMATQWASGNAKMYRDKIQKAALNGQSTVKASGKDSQMSIDEATARALQYEAFAKAAKAEANNRKVVSPVAYDHIDEAESDEAYRTSNSTMMLILQIVQTTRISKVILHPVITRVGTT